MSKSTAVAPIPEPALPDLAPTTTLEIGTEDVQLPRLYMGQPNGDAVQEGRVPAHCLWVGLGADDPDPNILWTQEDLHYDPKDPATKDAGVLCHVLSMTKGVSCTMNGELQSFRPGDPDIPEFDDNGKKPQETFNYVVCLPEVDQDVPVKLLLKSTSAKTAKRINYQLVKAAKAGPAHALAFRLEAVGKKDAQYRWSEMTARLVTPDRADVDIADAMVRMLGDRLEQEAVAAVDEPAI